MKNIKSFKWGYGIIASLVIGLSGCYMDGNTPHNVDYSTQNTMPQNASKAKPATKSYASKEVTQKATPGPKQTAAPQLPVIQ